MSWGSPCRHARSPKGFLKLATPRLGAAVHESLGQLLQACPLVIATAVFWYALQGVVAAQCIGDCNGDNAVGIDEVVRGVGIALNTVELAECLAFDSDADDAVTVDELVAGVGYALGGCPAKMTPTRSIAATSTDTPTATATTGGQETPSATSSSSPELTPTTTPTPRIGFTISGCVNEFPGEPCGQIFATVRLQPLGLTSTIGAGSQYFSFENIPPGNYVLIVVQGCNPFGCWEDTPVVLADEDVFIAIDLVPQTALAPTMQ